jgi:hypothetical protein
MGLIGVSFIASAQAVQPYKHVTYGDVLAAFENSLGSSYLVMWHAENFHAAPAEGKTAAISPWWGGEYCVDDAHYIAVGAFMNEEDHELAHWLWQWQKDGNADFDFYLDGEYMPNKLTALKRLFFDHPAFRDPGEDFYLWGHYGWWFNTGILFKPGEIPVGIHSIRTVMWGKHPDTGEIHIHFDWTAYFEILECWH